VPVHRDSSPPHSAGTFGREFGRKFGKNRDQILDLLATRPERVNEFETPAADI